MSTRLGVDLGTTWTAAALDRDGTIDSVKLEAGSDAMPSVVALADDAVLTGTAAEALLATSPSSGAREFKRRFGDTTPLVIGGTPYGAEALMAKVLEAVVGTAQDVAGGPIDTVVLTHPANWGEYKLELLRDVGRLAGIDDLELVPEPAAAAMHYAGLGEVPVGGVVAIYDFGGGTFDAAIVRVESDGAQILGTPQGLERLGGVDFDQIVFAHVDATTGGELGSLDTSDPGVRSAVMALRAACTSAKEALSTNTDATIPVRLPGLTTDVRMTRDEFEAGIRPRLADTLGALDRAIASADVSVGDLDGVLLVGGTSNIPLVSEMVASHTGRPVLSQADRKQVVVLGAAAGTPTSTDTAAAMDTGQPDAPSAPASKGQTSQPQEASRKRIPRLGLAARAAAAAGVVGVAGAGGYAAWRLLAGEDGDEPVDGVDSPDIGAAGPTRQRILRDELGVDDEPLDAFDQPSPEPAAFSGTPQGRVTDAVFRSAPAGSPAVRQAAPPPPPPPPSRAPDEQQVAASHPVSVIREDPAIEEVRARLLERLESFQPPEGADPEDAAKLKADLEGLLERYQPYAGQSVDDAVATLRYEFEDRVRDFAQDQRIEAVIAEQERQILEAEELETRVDEFKEQLSERLETWQPPEGADPAEAAELKAELEAMLDRYVAVPGQSPEDALAELRYRFNDEVGDFAQDLKIDALVEEQRDADGTEEDPTADEAEPDDSDVASDEASDEPALVEPVDDDAPTEDTTEEALAGLEIQAVGEFERIRADLDRETLVARPAEEIARLEVERAAVTERLEAIKGARASTDPDLKQALVERYEDVRTAVEDVPGTGVVADAVMIDPVPTDASAAMVDVFDEIAGDDMTVMTAPGGSTDEGLPSVADTEAIDNLEAVADGQTPADVSTQDDVIGVDDVMGTTEMEDAVAVADEQAPESSPTADVGATDDVGTAAVGPMDDDLVVDDLLGVAPESAADAGSETLAEDTAEVDAILTEEIPDVESEVLVDEASDVDVLSEEIPDVESEIVVEDFADDALDAFDSVEDPGGEDDV